jgi:diacylglycerol kinase (ATP)
MRSLCLVNPAAGGGLGEKIGARATELLFAQGLKFDRQLTEAPGHAACLAQAAADAGYQRIIVCGGDGTVNEVANGVPGRGLSLGIIPCGRGNDWAHYMGIPKNVEAACTVCLNGRPIEVDAALMGKRFYCSVACMGLAAEVNKIANENQYTYKGRLAYLLALWHILPHLKSYQIKVKYDAGIYEGQVLLLAVGNSAYFGGGLQITPKALTNDGLLDICIVEMVSKLRFLRSFPAVFSGAHLRYNFVKYIRSPRVEIISPEALEVFADGEYFQQLPVTILIRSRVLRMLVP